MAPSARLPRIGLLGKAPSVRPSRICSLGSAPSARPSRRSSFGSDSSERSHRHKALGAAPLMLLARHPRPAPFGSVPPVHSAPPPSVRPTQPAPLGSALSARPSRLSPLVAAPSDQPFSDRLPRICPPRIGPFGSATSARLPWTGHIEPATMNRLPQNAALGRGPVDRPPPLLGSALSDRPTRLGSLGSGHPSTSPNFPPQHQRPRASITYLSHAPHSRVPQPCPRSVPFVGASVSPPVKTSLSATPEP